MNEVTIEHVGATDTTLTGRVTADGRVDRFLSGEPFVADYGVDVSDVPESILTVPVLAHVCPVAWATGATVRVDRVDAAFLETLRHVGERLCEMYPTFMEGGRIVCGEAVEGDEPGTRDRSAMLFTGGVDSMATYVRHREETPDLISIKGWVIRDDDRWERNREYFQEFAAAHGVDNRFVESNMLDFLATPLLQAHFQRYLDGAWYSSVGHGLGLLGLCAPLAVATDVGQLYIAATHTGEWTRPWGSHPTIDDHVQWSGTQAVHDGYESTRQEKIETIADYVRSDAPDLTLRTCIHSERPENCNDCEKCYRTIVGLLLAGLDPNDHGYAYDAGTVDEIRDGFESGEWVLIPTKEYHWGILQTRANEVETIDAPGATELLTWLRNADFGQYVDQSDRPLKHRLVQATARQVPTPVYSTLYPVYRQVATNRTK
jgi:hypothetical protein